MGSLSRGFESGIGLRGLRSSGNHVGRLYPLCMDAIPEVRSPFRLGVCFGGMVSRHATD